MFTEKQHEAIARAIFNVHKEVKGMDLHHHPSLLLEAGERIRSGLSKMFAEDNLDFNPEKFDKACLEGEVAAMDWDKAETHFKEVLDQYKELVGQPGVNVMFAISLTFDPLLKRFSDGERTQDLYDAMLGVK